SSAVGPHRRPHDDPRSGARSQRVSGASSQRDAGSGVGPGGHLTMPRTRGGAGLLLLTALGLAASPAHAQDDGWRRAAPDYAWEFPRDHGPHAGYRTEWWYFTGHLATSPGGPPR